MRPHPIQNRQHLPRWCFRLGLTALAPALAIAALVAAAPTAQAQFGYFNGPLYGGIPGGGYFSGRPYLSRMTNPYVPFVPYFGATPYDLPYVIGPNGEAYAVPPELMYPSPQAAYGQSTLLPSIAQNSQGNASAATGTAQTGTQPTRTGTNSAASTSPHAIALTGNGPIPRTSDWIDAKLVGDNQIDVSWQGDPQAVNRVVFSLLDKNRKPVKQQVVTSTPVEARLTLTNKTAYYQVYVEYVNGTTTSVVAPL